MSRYRSYAPRDTEAEPIGDRAFLSLDMKRDPGTLQAGVLAAHENGRLVDGVMEPRKGCMMPVWCNPAFGMIYGSGVFSNPNDEKWGLLVVVNGVWAVRDGVQPRRIELPVGVTISAPCDLEQCFNVVVLFRGEGAGLEELVWNGDFNSGFQVINATSNGDYTDPIPNASTGENYANRLLVPFDRDRVAVSDIGVYTRYDADFAEFQINVGSADRLVRVYGWDSGRVVMFKGQSILMVSNATGDFSEARLDPAKGSIGLVGREAVCEVGSDLMFLSRSGVFALSEVFQAGIKVTPTPLSYPVDPVIKTINWKAAAGAVMQTWGQHVYLAVPTGTSEKNNVVLVLRILEDGSRAWQSVDSYEGLDIDAFLLMDYCGDERLFAVDYTAGRVVMLEEGEEDIIGTTVNQVRHLGLTRGYQRPVLEEGVVRRLAVEWETWDPRIQVRVLSDGVAENLELETALTKSRSSYYNFGKADWNPSNENDDHGERGREDYSVVLSGDGMELGSGIVLDLCQATRQPWPVEMRGNSLQVELLNTSGRMRVKGIQVETTTGSRTDRVQAGG